MDTLAQIGFAADTTDLLKIDKALASLEKAGLKAEASTKKQETAAQLLISTMRKEYDQIGQTNSQLASRTAAMAGATDAERKMIEALQDDIDYLKKLNEEEKRRISGLTALMSAMREQTETLGMSQKELLLYKAAQLGATDADQKALSAMYAKINAYEQASKATAESAADSMRMQQSVDSIVKSLQEEKETLGMTAAEMQRYQAAKNGASSESMRLISALQQEIEATRKSQAATANALASEQQRLAAIKAMTSSLTEQVGMLGMTSKELALYKANQLGATQADKQAIVAAIDKIEAYERSAAAAKANALATSQMGGAYGGARGAMQSFGYQLQDTIVQAQMGANAFMILSQQGSQMASAFGPTGAIVGALIAVAGVAGMVLAPSLMDSKTNAEKLATAMDALGEAAERNEDGVLQLTNEIKELAKQSDLAAKAQLQAVMIKSAEAMTLASKAAADMVDSLTGAGYGLYDVSDAMKELNLQFGYFGGGRSKAFTETVTEIGEKFGQTGKAAEQLGIDVLKAIKAMGEAKSPEGINKAREYLLQTAQAAKMSDKELADFIVTINKLATDGITAADTAKLLADSLSDGGVGAASAKDKLKELTQQAMLAKEEFVNGEAAAQKLALAFELGFDSAKQLTPELSAQVDELIRWQKAGKEVEEQIRRIAKLEAEMEDAFGGEDMLTEVYQNRAKAAEKLMDEWSEGVDTFDQDNKRAVSISEKAAERIEEAFADAWMNAFDGFESVVDGMKNAFKRMLAEMAHMALTRPIMISMGMGGMLPGGASASSIGGAASGLGLLGSIGGGITGLGSLIGGSFGGGLMGGGALVGAGQFGTLFSGAGSLLGSGNIMAGLGMATPIIAGLGAALAGIQKLSGGGLFGTSFKTTGQSLGLSLGGGDITGSITTEESRKKSLFRGTKRRTSTSGYDASAIDDAFDAISESLLAAATTFGIEGADAVIKGFASSVNIDIKDKTEAEIQDAIAAWVGSTTEGLVNAVFGDSLDGLQKEGEGVVDTVNRLAMNMQAVKGVTDVLGVNFGLTGKAAMVAATNIVELAGGLEQLSALTSQYYSAFYSDAEQQANLLAQLSESFAALNVTMPDTREGFRALVDGLDLTSEAGQKMFAELMKLVPGMDQYLSALEAQRQASEDAAEAARKEAEAKAAALKAQGLDLQLRLYDALGQSAEALALRRQMELDATDETLRALLLQIYAAEDAAAAQRELASAQDAAAQSARDAASAAIDAAQNAFGKLQESAQREKDRLGTELDLKLEAINAEKDLLKQQRDSVIDGYQEQGKAVEQYVNKLEGLNDILTGFLSDTGTQANPFKELAMIYNEAKAGLLPDSSRLSSVLSGVSSSGSAGFSSAFEQNRAMAIARNQAAGIQGIVGGAMGGAKSQLQWIEYQATAADEYYIAQLAKLDLAAETAQKLHDEQVGKIDEQLTEAQKQLNALLGVDDRLLTIDQALIEFYAAMNAANELGLGVASEQVAAINRVEAAIVQVGQQIVEIAKPGGRVWVPPTMPDRYTTNGEPISQEMVNLLNQILSAQESTAKHTAKTADTLQRVEMDGLDTRAVV